MTPPVPPEARARIERALADVELTAIEVARTAPYLEAGRFGIILRAKADPQPILPAALDALADIVEVISGLPWTAGARRRAVARYEKHLCTGRPFTPAAFAAAKREQPWWRTFQERLRQAEQTDVRSVGQQLRALKAEDKWTNKDLADATHLTQRTIERLLADTNKRALRVNTRTTLETVLTEKHGRPITITVPPRLPRKRIGKKSDKRR